MTLDNFSAHITGVEIAPPPSNIRVEFLPRNSTSKFQPLDQGIINSFKAHYRKQWLSYILSELELDYNPLVTMNLHLTIRWTLQSWYNSVETSTIQNCFRKSTLSNHVKNIPNLPTNIPDLTELFNSVQKATRISDAMTISNFLNPVEEIVDDSDLEDKDVEIVLQTMIQDHLDELQPENQDDNSIDDSVVRPIITLTDAQQALYTLIDYTEGCDNIKSTFLRSLEGLQQEFETISIASLQQTTLDRFFS